jgi:hypothetical protein
MAMVVVGNTLGRAAVARSPSVNGSRRGRGGPERHSARGLTWFEIEIRIQTRSNDFKFSSDFYSFKRWLPLLQNFKIKYGWKELEIRSNFPYYNFSRFKMEFELKIRELL